MRNLTALVVCVFSLLLVAGCRSNASQVLPRAAPPPRAAQPAVPPTDARQVFIDMSMVRIPEGEIDAVLGTLRPKAADKPTFLSDAQAAELQERLRASTARVISAPKILALEGQEASMVIGESIPFARKNGGLAFGSDDTGKPVFVGQQVRLVARPNPTGSRIGVELHVLRRDPLRGKGEAPKDREAFLRELTIEYRLDASFEVANGGTVLLGQRYLVSDEQGTYLRVTLLRAIVMHGPG